MGAVVDLAFETIGLVPDIVHHRVDRDPGEEARRIADAVAGAVEALGHPRHRPDELEDVDVIDIVHPGIVAELGRIAGDRKEIADAVEPRPEELRLETHQAGVARGDVGHGLETGAALDLGGEGQRVHPQPGQRVGVDVDGVHRAVTRELLGRLQHRIGIGPLGRIELDDTDELAGFELGGEADDSGRRRSGPRLPRDRR